MLRLMDQARPNTDQRKEVISRARQEEGRQQDEGAQAPAQAGLDTASAAGHRRWREGRLSPALRERLRPWWERDPALLRLETEGLRYAGFRVRQLTDEEDRLVLRADRGGSAYRVTYPHAFPAHGSVVVTDDLPLEEQPRVRTFWGEPPMGLAAIDRLLHEPPLFFSALGTTFPMLVPPSWRSVGRGDGGTLELGIGWGGAVAAYDLTGSEDAARTRFDATSLRRAFPVPASGWWYRGEEPDWSDSAEAITRRIEEGIARTRGISVARVRAEMHGRFGAVAYTPRWSPGAWCFVTRTRSGEARVGVNQQLDRLALRRRAPHAAELERWRAAIVGCGALGWSIAVALARAGVTRFDLYDNDVLAMGNLPRIGARYGLIGRPKVDALRREIESVALDVEARAHPVRIGEEAGASALVAAQPDLIIDATADDLAPVEVNLAALALERPALYAWTSGGVAAARIFRVVPDRTACYRCVQYARPAPIAAAHATQTDLPGEFIWNGANFNIDAVASAATRMAVRTLLLHESTAGDPDHIVLSFGGPVPVARSVEIARDPKCELCGMGRTRSG